MCDPSCGADDMATLNDVTEEKLLQNLSVRYAQDNIYTLTGPILIAINPYKRLKCFEAVDVKKYSGRQIGELPPHIFAVGASAYQAYKDSFDRPQGRTNQTIIISGESGAGKTESTKLILKYLTAVSNESDWIEQQIMESNTILEAFGNAKTVRNDNSSRFGKFLQVVFDKKNCIRGAAVEDYLLEQSRVVFQQAGERNYHVFYQLLAACNESPEYAAKLQIADCDPASYHYLNQGDEFELDHVDDSAEFDRLRLALSVMKTSKLGADEPYSTFVFKYVSAVLQIGNVKFDSSDGESVTISDKTMSYVSNVSELLQVPLEGLVAILCKRKVKFGADITIIPRKPEQAVSNRDAMSKALYRRLFGWLVQHINACMTPKKKADNVGFIGVLDIFGFENFEVNSFEQLCINYTNEKLQKFFTKFVFSLELEEYTKEGINFEDFKYTDNQATIDIIEKSAQSILATLDEQSHFPKATDATFLEKIHAHHAANTDLYKKPRMRVAQFGIVHYAGTVTYHVEGFLEKNKDADQDDLFKMLEKSRCEFSNDMATLRQVGSPKQRKKSITKSVPGKSKKKASVCSTFKAQLASLVATLGLTDPWYVRCLKPNHTKSPNLIDGDFAMCQLRYLGILETVFIRQRGYQYRFSHEDFIQKYGILAMRSTKDAKGRCTDILKSMGNAKESDWQIGKTKTFMRPVLFNAIEDQQKKVLYKFAVCIQKNIAMHAKRKTFLAMKMNVQIIQKWVRGFVKRVQYKRMRKATLKIQCFYREQMARRQLRKLLQERTARKQEAERKENEMSHEEYAEYLEKEAASQEEERKRKENDNEKIQAAAKQKTVFSTKNSKQNRRSYYDRIDGLKRTQESFGGMNYSQVVDAAQDQTTAKYLEAEQRVMEEDRKLVNEHGVAPEQRISETYRRDTGTYGDMYDDSNVDNTYKWAKYAAKYFAEPKAVAPGGVFSSLRKKKKAEEGKVSFDRMVAWSKQCITQPHHLTVVDSKFAEMIVASFHDMQRSIDPRKCNFHMFCDFSRAFLQLVIDYPSLCDEFIFMAVRMTNENPHEQQTKRAWLVLSLCCITFGPTNYLLRYLVSYANQRRMDENPAVRWYAAYTLDSIKRVKMNGPRTCQPSNHEIQALDNLQSVMEIKVHFLDGRYKEVTIDSTSLASDVLTDVLAAIDVESVSEYGLFENTGDHHLYLRGQQYVADAMGRQQLRDEAKTIDDKEKHKGHKKNKHTKDMGGANARFVLKRVPHKRAQMMPTAIEDVRLAYYQAVADVVSDNLRLSDRICYQLAGLSAQFEFGNCQRSHFERYEDEELEKYFPKRMRDVITDRETKDRVTNELMNQHSDYDGKNKLECMVLYLRSVMQLPMYGSAFFKVKHHGVWSHPDQIMLCIGKVGIRFMELHTRDTWYAFEFDALIEWELKVPSIVLKVSQTHKSNLKRFEFITPAAMDIVNLIVKFSPQHRTGVMGGGNSTKVPIASNADLTKARRGLIEARQTLIDVQVVGREYTYSLDSKEKGSMPTTDTMRGTLWKTNRNKHERTMLKALKQGMDKTAVQDAVNKEYMHHVWRCQKHKLSFPMKQDLDTKEHEVIALQIFNNLLVEANELPEKEMYGAEYESVFTRYFVLFKQLLRKSSLDLVDEYFLQCIKQTTEPLNTRFTAWGVFMVLCTLVAPTRAEVATLLKQHLVYQSLRVSDQDSEINRKANFCYKHLIRVEANGPRKFSPLRQELMRTREGNPLFRRFWFLDGTFRSFEYDAVTTAAELVKDIKKRIGLGDGEFGFELVLTFPSLVEIEDARLVATDKVQDMYTKYYKVLGKKHGYADIDQHMKFVVRQHMIKGGSSAVKEAENPVHFNLQVHHAIEEVKNDRYPITKKESIYLCGLLAQWRYFNAGNISDEENYKDLLAQCVPNHIKLKGARTILDLAEQHQKHRYKSIQKCMKEYYSFILQWPMYGAVIFNVTQMYTSSLPKRLWFGINEKGVYMMIPRTKEEPIRTIPFHQIVDYIPSSTSLILTARRLSKEVKYMLDTTSAKRICKLLDNYHQPDGAVDATEETVQEETERIRAEEERAKAAVAKEKSEDEAEVRVPLLVSTPRDKENASAEKGPGIADQTPAQQENCNEKIPAQQENCNEEILAEQENCNEEIPAQQENCNEEILAEQENCNEEVTIEDITDVDDTDEDDSDHELTDVEEFSDDSESYTSCDDDTMSECSESHPGYCDDFLLLDGDLTD